MDGVLRNRLSKSNKLLNSIGMKGIFDKVNFVLYLFAAVLLMVGCNKKRDVLNLDNATLTPENTVKNFLLSVDQLDFKTARLLTIENENTRNSMNNIEKFTNGLNDSQKAKYVSEKKTYNFITENKSSTNTTIIAANDQGNYTSHTIFTVVLHDKKWLIENVESED